MRASTINSGNIAVGRIRVGKKSISKGKQTDKAAEQKGFHLCWFLERSFLKTQTTIFFNSLRGFYFKINFFVLRIGDLCCC
jgi:hypothetical protein